MNKKKTICSVSRRNKGASCFDNSLILEMRDYWNETYPLNKVPASITKPNKILSFIQSNIPCKREICWLNQQFMTRNISKERLHSIRKVSFAPFAPLIWRNNLNAWLSNVDIDNVLNQYESLYNGYKHISTASIDFAEKNDGRCINRILCDFDIMSYIKRKLTKISIVLNTSKSGEPGEHWIAVFININKGTFHYYDSLGGLTPPEIIKFYKNIEKQCSNNNKKLKYIENNVVHQYNDGQCGMFCLNFIINMLVMNKFNVFNKTQKQGYDNIMKKMRNDMFNIL
jgi:hypothetical protein